MEVDKNFYTCITRGTTDLNMQRVLVVFFHGFAQTMSGSYGLYALLANEILKTGKDFLCFDLPGCGDSEGELYDYTFDDWIDLSKRIIETFIVKYEYIVFVGNASGNILALELEKYFSIDDIILLEPYEDKLQKLEYGAKIVELLDRENNDIMNTSDIGDWSIGNSLDDFFVELGAGLNRARGLRVRKDLLKRLITYNYLKSLKRAKCKVYIYHNAEGTGLVKRDNLFMSMVNREKVRKYFTSFFM